MRIAQLGAGRIGAMHAPILADLLEPGALVLADADPERAIAVAAEVGATAASIDEAIAGADALVIAASSGAHPTLVRAGLARGIPIFCEKPLAVDLPETRRLVEEIEASGIRFQLGFQRRYDAGYREARRLVESGELGRLYVVRLAGHDPEPPHEAYIATSGGLFNDFSVHDFDVTRYLTGQEIVEVYADGDVLGVRDVREVRRRRHGGGDPPAVGGDAGDPVVHAARPARLRHPHRAVRVAGQRQRRARAADADAVSRAGRAAAGRPSMEGLPRTVRRCVS